MSDRPRELRDYLVAAGQALLHAPPTTVTFAGDTAADELLNDLEGHPHAFVFGCLADRQEPAERAWMLPAVLRDRLGGFDFQRLAVLTEAEWQDAMQRPSPAHRLAETMAEVLFLATQRIAESYAGDASRIWGDAPSSATLVRRFLEFYGAGAKIATMAASILVREFKVPLSDYRYLDISADDQVRRVMTRLGYVEAGSSADLIIYAARELNPDFPGIFDAALFNLGRDLCRPTNPACGSCQLRRWCAHAVAEHGGTSPPP